MKLKKIEEDIAFDIKNFIESLYYSKNIVEVDVIENFDNESGQFLKNIIDDIYCSPPF